MARRAGAFAMHIHHISRRKVVGYHTFRIHRFFIAACLRLLLIWLTSLLIVSRIACCCPASWGRPASSSSSSSSQVWSSERDRSERLVDGLLVLVSPARTSKSARVEWKTHCLIKKAIRM